MRAVVEHDLWHHTNAEPQACHTDDGLVACDLGVDLWGDAELAEPGIDTASGDAGCGEDHRYVLPVSGFFRRELCGGQLRRFLWFGEQRLALIARAMVKHPPMLILDEPCLGLDDLNRQLVLALIERICESSETTVLYVNHREQDRIQGIDHHLALE